ncbi:flavin reductase family protein [Streptomyces sp. CA2R101]|uniref:flavin reductase family protein n=1 Tax=Streptomyces sp. CA2R101 TaxID=3120152 RepID=UPI003009E61F
MDSNGAADTDPRDDASPARLRQALGQFASGVTVVTTATGEPGDLHAHGMTANAFTSVSLEPPLVLISVAAATATHRRIAGTGRYGISILSEAQEPLSKHFAGGTQRPELVRFVWRDGLPLLSGALVHLSCRVRQSHRAGDHTLFIGEVEGLWCGSGPPLVHFRKQLHTLDIPHRGEIPALHGAGDLLAEEQTERPVHVR